MQRLQRTRLLEIHKAALEVGITESREALLSAMPARFAAAMTRSSTPASQLLLDLSALNQISILSDGSDPLRIWLETAYLMSAHDPRAKVFADALNELNENKSAAAKGSSEIRGLANTTTAIAQKVRTTMRQDPPSTPPEAPRPSRPEPIRIFLDYAYRDEPFAEQLRRYITPLIRSDRVRLWDHQQLTPGENRKERAEQELRSAHIYLVLLSADYFADDYSHYLEPLAQELQASKNLRIIPIVVRPCFWEKTIFGSIQALPQKGAISQQENIDEAMYEIVRALVAIIDDFSPLKASPPQSHIDPSPTNLASHATDPSNRLPLPEAEPGTPLHLILPRNGTPKWNYIEPEQSAIIARELRNMGRGLVVEGPSKIGKTTALRKILQDLQRKNKTASQSIFLDSTVPKDMEQLREIFKTHSFSGHLVLDEAHRLSGADLENVAGLMRSLAERSESNAKLTLIGLRSLSRLLLSARRDLAGRFDTVSMDRQPDQKIIALLELAERSAGISFNHRAEIAHEALGSFYLAQVISYFCAASIIDEVPEQWTAIPKTPASVQQAVFDEIAPPFEEALRRLIRADRDTETPGACFTLLYMVSQSLRGMVPLISVRRRYPLLGPAFEWAENGHLATIIDGDMELPGMMLFAKGTLSIVDPVVLYYLRMLDWRACGHDEGLILEWVNGEPEVVLTRKKSAPIPAGTAGQNIPAPEHFLDQPVYPWWNPQAVELKDWLVRAYLKPIQIELLAQQAGIDLAYWDGMGAADRAWISLLDITANQGKLRDLLAKALADKSKEGFHKYIKACTEVPNSPV